MKPNFPKPKCSDSNYWVLGLMAFALLMCSCKKDETATQQSDPDPAPAMTEQKQEKPTALIPQEETVNTERRTIDSHSQAQVDSQARLVKPDVSEVKESVEIVTDPALIKVPDGLNRPKRGDKIYTYNNLPKDACGTYWVREESGDVAQLAVCRDEH
jgi:hypothetical protein